MSMAQQVAAGCSITPPSHASCSPCCAWQPQTTRKNLLHARTAVVPSTSRVHIAASPGQQNVPAHGLGPAWRRRRVVVGAEAQQAAVGALPALLPLNDDYHAQHTFSMYGHWLIPGRVMLGRYPHCEPSAGAIKCDTAEAGDRQIAELLAAGINTFVCLQAELPPQADITEQGVPLKGGVFLSYDGPARAMAPPGTALEFLHHPIPDLSTPTPEEIVSLVDALIDRLRQGAALYVHCWGGRGRAGTLGACLLGRAYGLDAKEALERVSRSYATRDDSGRRSPETEAQIQFVADWVQRFGRSGAGIV